MRYAYPCTLADDGDGGFIVTFPDVPEALTGARDLADALVLAEDALVCALAEYGAARRDIPPPSAALRGQRLVPVPPVAAAKLALYQAMRAQGITKVELARRLEVSEAAVRKLTSLDHRSHIGQVERALRAVGRTLVLEDHAA